MNWIDCKERLPEPMQKVQWRMRKYNFINQDEYIIDVGWFNGKDFCTFDAVGDREIIDWKPLTCGKKEIE